MKSKKWWQLIACSLIFAPIFAHTVYSQLSSSASDAEVSSVLTANICTDIANWDKPSLDAQIKTLSENQRYGEEIDQPPLQELFSQLWNHQVFVFTEYGLSARIEPIYLSGVWTVFDRIWNCYSEEQIEALNSSQKAEIWLLGAKFMSLKWENQQYYLTVESREKSFQIIQFERQENESLLPLNVVNTDNKNIPFLDLKLEQ